MLRLSTCEDTNLVQTLHLQWQQAVNDRQVMERWNKRNPYPGKDGSQEELSRWFDDYNAHRQQHNIPDFSEPGRLQQSYATGAWTLKLLVPVRDSSGRVRGGDRVTQCTHCTELFATCNHRDHHCSDECKAAADEAKAKAKKGRRQAHLKARTEALAARTGVCICCGEEFPLKRTTAKTCSPRCRKRLLRGEEPQQVRLPALTGNLAAMKQELNALRDQAMASALAAIRGDQNSSFDTAALDRCKQQVAVEQHKHDLHVIYAHAPALAAWLLKQPDQIQRTATGDTEEAIRLLGPDLHKKLGASH